jgi:hypothetical protein
LLADILLDVQSVYQDGLIRMEPLSDNALMPAVGVAGQDQDGLEYREPNSKLRRHVT